MINRIEWLAGRRWAQETCFAAAQLLKLQGGHGTLIAMLKRGLVEKPQSYAAGVQDIITIVEDAVHVQAPGEEA